MGDSSILNSLNNNLKKVNEYNEKLSTGKRINKAKDDSAGLAILSGLEGDVAVQTRGVQNAYDGLSALSIEDGTLSGLSDMSIRMKELAMQSANGTLSDSQRQSINEEYTALLEESQRQVATSEFNGKKLISSDGFFIQTGNDSSENSQIKIEGSNIIDALETLPRSIATQNDAMEALDIISDYTEDIASERGKIGTAESRILSNISSNEIKIEGEEEAASRIRDVDVAETMSKKVSSEIQTQVSTSLLAHNNLQSDIVLKLLG